MNRYSYRNEINASKPGRILRPKSLFDRVLNLPIRVTVRQCLMERVVDAQWCFERDRTRPPILP